MSETLLPGSSLFEIILILASVVSVTGLLVWLVGLALVLRGSSPRERASILRAYGQCPPYRCPMPTPAKSNAKDLPTDI